MGLVSSKTAENNNIVDRNYNNKNPYKIYSGYTKKEESKDFEMVVNHLENINDHSYK